MLLPTVLFLAAVHLSSALDDAVGFDGCFVYDTSIGHGKEGNGAGVVEDVPSAAACQHECQMNDECNVWIWNEPTKKRKPNVCWMKRLATAPSQEKKDMHRISGPKVCDCFMHDATIPNVAGNGAGKVDDVFSALECQMHCQMTDECNAFIWNDAEHKRNPNVCWMKKSFGDKPLSLGKKKDSHRHTGPKVCPPRPAM